MCVSVISRPNSLSGSQSILCATGTRGEPFTAAGTFWALNEKIDFLSFKFVYFKNIRTSAFLKLFLGISYVEILN